MSNCNDEVMFLLKYFEKNNYDRNKFKDLLLQMIENGKISKKSIDVVIIMTEMSSLYNKLDNNLVKSLKDEYNQSRKVANRLRDEVDAEETTVDLDDLFSPLSSPLSSPSVPKTRQTTYSYDPCSHTSYSGSSRGGC